MQIVVTKTLEDTLYNRNIPVLTYKINFPCFNSNCGKASTQAVNSYYLNLSKNTEIYCRTVLFSIAVENTRYLQPDRPFNSYTIDVNYNITFNCGCVTSLYIDTYTYLGGAHGDTKRISDTWNFITGTQMDLDCIYSLSPSCIEKLQKRMRHQVRERLVCSPGSYFDNYSDLLVEHFSPESYYLVQNGFTIYYQQYEIAPYVTGIPEFFFPRCK